MHSVDVDFDGYKALTMRRATEDVTYNDVLREVLGLGKANGKATVPKPAAGPSPEDWVAKGVRFLAATEFRASYKGQTYTGRVEGGALVVNGKRFDSPSAAAVSITSSPVNGWRFWECRMPGKATWVLIESLRR